LFVKRRELLSGVGFVTGDLRLELAKVVIARDPVAQDQAHTLTGAGHQPVTVSADRVLFPVNPGQAGVGAGSVTVSVCCTLAVFR
jgi:hypothetical protein